ncbi:MAG: hypothetical protein KK482_05130 [Sinorhizobium meliloti]|nr:hypothetical protein [Sinorhizobium meliloti]
MPEVSWENNDAVMPERLFHLQAQSHSPFRETQSKAQSSGNVASLQDCISPLMEFCHGARREALACAFTRDRSPWR